MAADNQAVGISANFQVDGVQGRSSKVGVFMGYTTHWLPPRRLPFRKVRFLIDTLYVQYNKEV